MSWFYKNKEQIEKKEKAKKAAERVKKLHEIAKNLIYVNDAYFDTKNRIILEVEVGKGKVKTGDSVSLFDCEGNLLRKGIIIEKIYMKQQKVELAQSGDKYMEFIVSKLENIQYLCGQLLIKE